MYGGELGSQGVCAYFPYDFANAVFGILGDLENLQHSLGVSLTSSRKPFLCICLDSTMPENLLSECPSEDCINYCGRINCDIF